MRKLMNAVRAVTEESIELIAPLHCAFCDQPVDSDPRRRGDEHDHQYRLAMIAGACTWCINALPGIATIRCVCCGIGVGIGIDATRVDATRCPACRDAPPAFDATCVLADYAPPLDKLIHRFKYQRHLRAAQVLGTLLAARMRARLPLPAWPGLLVPVPLSPARQRERGYNQSILLGRVIGRHLHIPVDRTALWRLSHHDSPQTSKSRRQRLARAQNLGQIMARRVAGQRVALIDDVMTSAATVQACAQALKAAGAVSVTNLITARTPKERAQAKWTT